MHRIGESWFFIHHGMDLNYDGPFWSAPRDCIVHCIPVMRTAVVEKISARDSPQQVQAVVASSRDVLADILNLPRCAAPGRKGFLDRPLDLLQFSFGPQRSIADASMQLQPKTLMRI